MWNRPHTAPHDGERRFAVEIKEHKKELAKWYEWMPISGFKCNHIQITEEELLPTARKG